MTTTATYHSSNAINQARSVNLGEFLADYDGSAIEVSTGYHRHIEHDSLVFQKNRYFYNSKCKNGDSIEYLQITYKVSFSKAVSMLLSYYNGDRQGNEPPIKVRKYTKKKKPDEVISETHTCTYQNEDIRHAYAYLYDVRKISHTVIKKFESEGYLWQDGYNNVCWQVRDYITQEPVGYFKRGTFKGSTYKGTSEGLTDVFFNITIGDPERIYLFEGCVDLMSYMRLFDPQNCVLLAMGGVKHMQALRALDAFDINDVVVAVNNDEAGENFTHSLELYNRMKKRYYISVEKPEPQYNDWNDELKAEYIKTIE